MHQSIQIIGDLGRDTEMRYTPSGQAVTNFSVATNHTYTSKAKEKVVETTWFRVSIWGSAAEACNQYLSKGSRVFVEGRLVVDKETGNPRVYEKKDGSWASTLEISASTVKFLDKKGAGKQDSEESGESEEDLPEYMRG
jgi:single-strand DNA-binding protein